jgi:hypothetical protein
MMPTDIPNASQFCCRNRSEKHWKELALSVRQRHSAVIGVPWGMLHAFASNSREQAQIDLERNQ